MQIKAILSSQDIMNCDLHSLAFALLWMLATASLALVWTWAIANEHGRPDGARPGEQWP